MTDPAERTDPPERTDPAERTDPPERIDPPGAGEALLAAVERAAFHSSPGAALVAARRLAGASARAGWVAGVCALALGRYGEARALLDDVTAGTGPAPREGVAVGARAAAGARAAEGAGAAESCALALAAAASLQRQVGSYPVAERLDQRAAALAGPSGEARLDALTGLVADAVGVGDAATAAARLPALERAVERARSRIGDVLLWRPLTRLGWVRAEVALLAGRPEEAVDAATEALAHASGAGAPRHEAKSLLFRGVAGAVAGAGAAVPDLQAARRLAGRLGCAPLAWPAAEVLAGLDPVEGAGLRAEATATVRRLADAMPADLRVSWLTRADVAAVHERGRSGSR